MTIELNSGVEIIPTSCGNIAEVNHDRMITIRLNTTLIPEKEFMDKVFELFEEYAKKPVS